MTTTLSRIQLLRGDIQGKHQPLRPPWSISEQNFINICNSCGDCIEACPTHIIKWGRGQLPVINFDYGECLFCYECAQQCVTGALIIHPDEKPWDVIASINEAQCLSYNNIACQVCSDPCQDRAIKIIPSIGGISIPHIDNSSCSGCGACKALCPANAITMQHLEIAA